MYKTDTMEVVVAQDLKRELAILKKKLGRGDQRKLAITLQSHPNRVSYAFDGFVSEPEFLLRLRNETQKLLKEAKSVKSPKRD
jgi:hypothetical protein